MAYHALSSQGRPFSWSAAMGFGGVSPLKLTIVLLIIVLIFGTKWLKSLAAYLGTAKSLRDAMGAGAAPRQAQHEKRSEERRVGKEWRRRAWPYDERDIRS